MNESHIHIAGRHILYDGDGAFDPAWFDHSSDRARRDERRDQSGLSFEAADGGRHRAEFFRAGGVEYFIRHYARGGFPARLVEDRYFYAGLNRSRSFLEWRLLAALSGRGLPAPRPVAASCARRGACYTAALITASCRPARPLAQRLREAPLGESGWRAVGKTIRRFHDEGVWHADLNAYNVLLTDAAAVFLIDFDRARLRADARGWKRANVRRLRRSLDKLASRSALHFSGGDFDALCDAYCGG